MIRKRYVSTSFEISKPYSPNPKFLFDMEDHLTLVICIQDNEMLIQIPSLEEIESIVKLMSALKYDSMLALFYKHYDL